MFGMFFLCKATDFFFKEKSWPLQLNSQGEHFKAEIYLILSAFCLESFQRLSGL